MLDSAYLEKQIERMERAVETDPALTIGTAKDLIETISKTILKERGKSVPEGLDVLPLAKLVLDELQAQRLFDPDSKKGSEKIRRLLAGLASVTQGVAELRNHYGTGHGKQGGTPEVDSGLAVLAAGASATFCRFVLRVHRSHPPAGFGVHPWSPGQGGGGDLPAYEPIAGWGQIPASLQKPG